VDVKGKTKIMTKLEFKILTAFGQLIIDHGTDYINTFFCYNEVLEILMCHPDNPLEELEKRFGWKPFEEEKINAHTTS